MSDKIPIEYIAALSNLLLENDEIEELSHDMTDIIELMDTIKELDVDDVPITEHISGVRNIMREDIAADPMATEDILSNAPMKMEDCFAVPKMIE